MITFYLFEPGNFTIKVKVSYFIYDHSRRFIFHIFYSNNDEF